MFQSFCFGVLLSPPLVHFKRTGCPTKHTAHHATSLPIPNKCARALAKKALDTARNVTKQNHSNNLETMWRTGHAIVFSGHRVSVGRMSIYKYIYITSYNLNIHKQVRTIAEQLCKDPVEHKHVYICTSIEHKCNYFTVIITRNAFDILLHRMCFNESFNITFWVVQYLSGLKSLNIINMRRYSPVQLSQIS